MQQQSIREIENLRDLGGYAAGDGRVTRGGMIFRSSVPSAAMSEEGKRRFTALGLQEIFDLRAADEAEYKPDFVPDGCRYRLMPTSRTERLLPVRQEDILETMRRGGKEFMDRGIAQMRTMYASLPFENPSYAALLEAMDRGERFLFHCSAGKDRTGVAAAMILLALGCGEADVRRDYMLTNVCRAEVNERIFASTRRALGVRELHPFVRLGFEADEALLDVALEAVRARYGSYDAWLEAEYGAGPARRAAWVRLYTLPADQE